jgi:predicted permease
MWNAWQDLRFALRVLRNSPGFAMVAVITLGIGIAANTTVFGWVETVLLRPIPGVGNLEELVALEGVSPEGRRLEQFPHPDFRDFQRQMTQFSGVAATHIAQFTIGPVDQPRRVLGEVVSANYFSVLDVKPFLGRLFVPEEDRDIRGAFPYAVISHRLWRTYFHADTRAVGRSVRINGHQYTLIGVTRSDFAGTLGGAALDMWVPLSMIIETGTLNTWAASDRNARFLNVFARLDPGVSIAQAREEARAVAGRMAAAYPDTHKGISASLVPIREAMYGLQTRLGTPLRILMAVCILVLLIACANVANLLMARSVSQQREFGIRIALGAGRVRLVRHLLAEVIVLAVVGALAGVLLAQWMGESLHFVLPSLDSAALAAMEPLVNPKRSWTVLVFAALIALATAVLSTLVPAVFAGRLDVNEALKEGGRGGTSGARSHRAREALVIAEVALAAMALIGAGLAVRSFQRLAKVDLGFDPRNVLVAHFHLSTNGYSLDQEKQFCRNLRLRLEAASVVEQVSYANATPLSIYGTPYDRVQALNSEADERGVVSLPMSVVAPGYFRLMRIPMIEGRDFTERDDLKAERVIIVNQTFAERYFEKRNPVGQRIRVSGKWATVIGVVKDSKYVTHAERPAAFFYGTFGQMFWSGHNNFFFVRAHDVEAARRVFRTEVAALDPNKGLYELSPLPGITEAGLFGERIAASLLTALGVLALSLAAIGLYSVMAYAVSERTQEIGIRMALGAQPRQVLRLVLRQGMAMAVAGIAIGAGGALVSARLLATLLGPSMSTAEPAVFAAAALCLILIALMASYIPARRATRVDPITALHSE